MDRRGRSVLQSQSVHKMHASLVEIAHVLVEVAPVMSGQLGIPGNISFGDSTMRVASLPAMAVEAIVGVAKPAMPVASMVGRLFQVGFQVRSPLNNNSNRSPQQTKRRQTVSRLLHMSDRHGEVTFSEKWI